MKPDEYRIMYHVEDTHWWYTALHELVLQFVPRGKSGMQILDAGCGTGRLLQLLSTRGSARGCDVSDAALYFCRERGLPHVVKADLNNAELGRGRYDVITSIDVLYHRRIRDDGAVVQKLADALRPGGTLILQVPAYEWLRSDHDRAVHTGRRYTRPRVVHLLMRCGLQVERATYRISFLLVPIAAARLLRRLSGRWTGPTIAASDVRQHSRAVNSLLREVMRVENFLLRRFSFPAGASVFAVARKPSGLPEQSGSLRPLTCCSCGRRTPFSMRPC